VVKYYLMDKPNAVQNLEKVSILFALYYLLQDLHILLSETFEFDIHYKHDPLEIVVDYSKFSPTI